MLVASGKDMQLGRKYSFSMLESLVKVLLSPDQRWRGVYNTLDSYEPNDVVLVVDGRNAFLKYAVVATSGAYDSGNWDDVKINISESGSGTGGIAYIKDITLTVDGWEELEQKVGDYAYKQVIADENVNETLSPDLIIHLNSLAYAESIGSVCETGEGTLTVYASSIPEADIFATVKYQGTTGESIVANLPIATATQLGCIKLGKFLEGHANGTVDVKLTDIDDETYDNELKRNIASDQDVSDIINDTFPNA